MNRELSTALAWSGGMIAVALAATAARKLGYMDGDTVTRVVIAMNGLWIMYYGNLLPKTVVSGECARRSMRVGGWAMVLSGLAYAGVFVFAPIPVAVIVGCGSILAGLGVTLGYSLWLRSRAKVV